MCHLVVDLYLCRIAFGGCEQAIERLCCFGFSWAGTPCLGNYLTRPFVVVMVCLSTNNDCQPVCDSMLMNNEH